MALAALVAAPVWAGDSNLYRDDDWSGNYQFEDPEAWQEGAVKLPPYPRDGDLKEVPINRKGFEFFVDTRHLAVGKDGVTRYTFVIRSTRGGGAANVFFEGIRCANRSYRAYGYGSSDGTLHRFERSEWKPVGAADTFGYRSELARFYFCDANVLPLPVEKIVDRIEHAADETYFGGSGFLFN
ncbi:CNP1-like family protein [Endothiovibrio diazotrophicus]